MATSRLSFALEQGALALPDEGKIGVFRPREGTDLSALPADRVQIEQGFRPDHDYWQRKGYACAPYLSEPISLALVHLPRAKAEARALIARAAEATGGVLWIDGQKTDGVDSVLKDLKRRGAVEAQVSKAHGKLFAARVSPEALADWHAPERQDAEGWVTAPGVFSADGPDPASVALANCLTPKIKGRIADLGAGWGYLTARLFEVADPREVHLVEAEYAALEAARHNVTDPRAQFHWADATRWSPPEKLDHILMNPPFHSGRAAEPALGQAFIRSAAHALASHGTLWLVANTHLPYEATLAECFRESDLLERTSGFKIIAARRPLTRRRG